MDEQQKQEDQVADASPSSTEAQLAGDSPNVATLAAAQSASDTSSSVPSASPASDTGAAASSDQAAGDLGNVVAAADGGDQSAGGVVAAGGDAGNVLAGGAPLVGITSTSIDESTDYHPAKPHLSALRRKIESGEAILMSDLLRLIHAIEETL